MKKLYFIIAAVLVVLGSLWAIDSAQGDNPLWKVGSGNLQPVSSGWNLQIGALAGSGVKCLHVDNTGFVSTSTADCGTGGGGGSSTVLWGISPIVVTALSNGNQTSSCPTCATANGTTTYLGVFDAQGDLVGYLPLTYVSSTGIFSAPS